MRILSRVLIYLVVINLLLLGVYIFLSKRKSDEEVGEKGRVVSEISREEEGTLRLYYKTGKVVDFGVRVLSSVANGGKEDRFEIVGIVENVWQEGDRVFLSIIIPGNRNLKLTFILGNLQRSIGINKAEKGKIGRYTVDKVATIFKDIVPNTPILIHVVSRIDKSRLGSKCNKKCLAQVEYVNHNYSKFSDVLFKVSREEKVELPDAPIGHISQVVYYKE